MMEPRSAHPTPVFWILFLCGVMIAFTHLFSPIHEQGHLEAAHNRGIGAEITSRTTTQVDRITLPILFAGHLGLWGWAAIGTVVVFCATRHCFGLVGLPFGYMHGETLKALQSSDFARMVEMGHDAPGTWLIVTLPVLLFFWCVLWWTRFVPHRDGE